ncbi:hypothetical protein BV133_2140 [Blastochloris viridis]|uniref:Uncharacterized protein n=1 Tax=Blastochloris viridis TaxID=1079 RepID=A0A182D3H5_BLAVI|nr:hypothetical protein BV133_2140 [Blastochloris viridis]
MRAHNSSSLASELDASGSAQRRNEIPVVIDRGDRRPPVVLGGVPVHRCLPASPGGSKGTVGLSYIKRRTCQNRSFDTRARGGPFVRKNTVPFRKTSQTRNERTAGVDATQCHYREDGTRLGGLKRSLVHSPAPPDRPYITPRWLSIGARCGI